MTHGFAESGVQAFYRVGRIHEFAEFGWALEERQNSAQARSQDWIIAGHLARHSAARADAVTAVADRIGSKMWRRGLAAQLFGVTSPLMDLTSMIETRPGVRSGKPCFVGTRIAVYDVLDYLASGMTSDEIVHDFPELTEQHVRAAIEFAAMRERRLATPA